MACLDAHLYEIEYTDRLRNSSLVYLFIMLVEQYITTVGSNCKCRSLLVVSKFCEKHFKNVRNMFLRNYLSTW
jgi:hypothetical protein